MSLPRYCFSHHQMGLLLYNLVKLSKQIWEAGWCLRSAIRRDGSQRQPQAPPLRIVGEVEGGGGAWSTGQRHSEDPLALQVPHKDSPRDTEFWASQGAEKPMHIFTGSCALVWDATRPLAPCSLPVNSRSRARDRQKSHLLPQASHLIFLGLTKILHLP